MPVSTVLILGGGIAGIAAALALSKELSPIVPHLKITIYELRDVPSTAGGAINLTPVAQRHLAQLGVLEELDKLGTDSGADVDAIGVFSVQTGKRIGNVDFAGKHGKGYDGYKGRRVMRICLQLALMAAAEKTSNINIEFGKKVIGGVETEEQVTVFFDDGSVASGDLAVGCDGVHSNTRTKIVDPGRVSEYTGISFIQATMKSALIQSSFHFDMTAINRSSRGALLTTFCDQNREELFVAALAEIHSQNLKDMVWGSHGAEYENDRILAVRRLRNDLWLRFGNAARPCIREIIEKCPNWFLYPVYQVRPGGKWCTERIMLLGDAAHAMPPKDESASYALDDAILFSRVIASYYYERLPSAFSIYESLRRKSIDEAYKQACASWERHKDMSQLAGKLEEWLTPWHLRKTKKARTGAWTFDAHNVVIPPPATGTNELWKDEGWSSDLSVR